MSDLVDRLLQLDPKKLKKRAKLRRKRRRCGKRRFLKHVRPKFNREELVKWAHTNEIKSRNDIMRKRKDGDPTWWDYAQEFGSWPNAVKYIGIKPQEKFKKKWDKKYVIGILVQFEIWKKSHYTRVYKTHKDIMPSVRTVELIFGSWTAAKDLAVLSSLKRTIALYRSLKKQLDRTPSVKDCRDYHVEIDAALKIFGTKNKFDVFIASLGA